MAMEFSAQSDRLTPAALSVLNEYTENYRLSVLNQAVRLSSSAEIGPKDIVNSAQLIETRSNISAYDIRRSAYANSPERRFRYAYTVIFYFTIMGILLLGGFAFYLALSRNGGGSDMTIIFSVIAAMTTTMIAVYSYYLSQSRRRAALRFEMENHDFLPVRVPDDAPQQNSARGWEGEVDLLREWLQLEGKLRDLVTGSLQKSKSEVQRLPISQLIRISEENGVISGPEVSAFRDLVILRNKIVHGRGLTHAERESMNSLIAELSSV